jgi:hypothetical protein
MFNGLLHGSQILIEKDDVTKYVQSFYHHLYTKDLKVQNNVQARKQCLISAPIVVTKKQNRILLQQFTNGKMRKTTLDLAKHKATGVNGIPMEFFQEAWPKVGNDIINLPKRAYAQGEALNISLQIFIPKQGEQNVIANYRSILVLRSTYKITSKTLANRFEPCFHE